VVHKIIYFLHYLVAKPREKQKDNSKNIYSWTGKLLIIIWGTFRIGLYLLNQTVVLFRDKFFTEGVGACC